MAYKNNITIPQKWHDTQLAGVDWLYHFRKRHSVLSLRTPEGCSLSRATSFNRHNVGIFFDNLQDVMRREPSFGNGTRVFNLDETNTMTVQKSGKVLAVRGQKQVSKVTSAEKGTLVTTCYIINALGQALPPVMIFPRVHFKQHMISGAPTGTLGLATASGWMNSDLFVKTMQHFINYTQSSKENPSLLIMDNFEAHICIEVITLAKENGVTILTVPPHSTGKLQPLDVAIFKLFKVAYNAAVDSWLMRNPGKTFSIYEVAQCIKEAHMKSMTPTNICSAFQSTGIYPFNRDIFTDLDFAPSEVTDREIEQSGLTADSPASSSKDQQRAYPNTASSEAFGRSEAVDKIIEVTPELSNLQYQCTTDQFQSLSPSILTPQNPLSKSPSPCLKEPIRSGSPMQSKTLPLSRNPLPFSQGTIISSSTVQSKTAAPINSPGTLNVSPFEFRGLPKAGARKSGRAQRRKGKSMIATDTPNKLEIENRNAEKKRKKDATSKKRKVLQESNDEDEVETLQKTKKVKQRTKNINTKNKKTLQSESSEEECDYMSVHSEEEAGYEEDNEDELLDIISENFGPLASQPKEGDYVLVQLDTDSLLFSESDQRSE